MEREAIAPDDTSADIAEKGYRNTILAMSRGAAADAARIAALEAQNARLTAPVTEAEVVDLIGTYVAMGRGPDAGHAALTAFLEGRVKG